MDTIINPVNSDLAARINDYFKTHDAKYLAEDAVFLDMSSGKETSGRENIAGMLHFIYHVAFDAKGIINNTFISGQQALLESTFVGKHIGEFAGIQATGNEVRVPLCVVYDLNSDGLIQKARIYMMTEVMMKQLKSD